VTCCYAYLGAFSMAYPFAFVADAERWAEIPEDLRAVFAEEAEAMWQQSLEAWRRAEAEVVAYDTLKEKGMQELDPMPLEDRKAIQAKLIEIWQGTCADLGETAVGYCNRIEAALQGDS